ncbi:arf-GAP with dual PH domain-containing protein 2-like [Sycon ciliatum]|uniref:arf-GAP with dual PH domain-containing protein 2-like n=2 Tax=Sycon ciliatum TaxID=27933 RepID=UPI0031F667CB
MTSIKRQSEVRLTTADQLVVISQQPGNERCADCGALEPDWSSTNLGILLCINCCGVHRKIGTHISQVKSIKLDDRSWTQPMIENILAIGNTISNAKYCYRVPIAYKRPSEDERTDPVLREEWIRAKYERQEFVEEARPELDYLSGKKSGILFKKGKGNKDWKARWFVLDVGTGNIKYYKSRSSDQPLGVLSIANMNACLASVFTNHPHSMQIAVPDTPVSSGRTRNIFVYSEKGRDIIEWLVAIRHARQEFLKLSAGDMLTKDFSKAGYLQKTGPNASHGWKKRWFVLDGRKLRYYGHPLDPFELHEINIGHNSEGYDIIDGITDGRRKAPQYGLTLKTPGRDFYLNAMSIPEFESWMEAIRTVIMTEDDLVD